jgi:hypothetical protein
MLFQQVPGRLIGELLEILHAISRQQVESIPGLAVELDALAGHRSFLADLRANGAGSSKSCP